MIRKTLHCAGLHRLLEEALKGSDDLAVAASVKCHGILEYELSNSPGHQVIIWEGTRLFWHSPCVVVFPNSPSMLEGHRQRSGIPCAILEEYYFVRALDQLAESVEILRLAR